MRINSKFTRRDFFKYSIGSFYLLQNSSALASLFGKNLQTHDLLIDLSLCDGCLKKGSPLCQQSCPAKNQDSFFSDKSVLVQHVRIEHQNKISYLSLPRNISFSKNCQECLNSLKKGAEPACARNCPQKAIVFVKTDKTRSLLYRQKKSRSNYVFKQTSPIKTHIFFASPVPFTLINNELIKQRELFFKDQDYPLLYF